jgi:phage terminase large subunit
MKITPTIRPTKKQALAWKKLLDKTKQFILFGGAAGGGKSWLICEWLLLNSYIYPGTKWFIARKELKRLMQSTYITFLKVCEFHNIPKDDWKLNGQYNFIEFKNGSRIDLLDINYIPSDPLFERLGSLEFTGGAIEEAGETEFLAFEVLKSRIGRHKNKEYGLLGKMLLTANPNKGYLYELFYKKDKEGELPDNYYFIKALYNDNPHTAEDYKKSLESLTDTRMRQRLMLGDWEYDDDINNLIKYENIMDLFTNTVDSGDKYITVDVARFGEDKSILMLWDGLKIAKVEKYAKISIDVLAEHIKLMAVDNKVPFSRILIDEDGVGGGVVDILRGVKGFLNNSVPIDRENFANLKTQCYYKLAEMINHHEISIEAKLSTDDRQMIIAELEQVKSRDLDKDGKFKLMVKEDVKKVLGRSPDYSDAMMMRMYFEFKATVKRQHFGETNNIYK